MALRPRWIAVLLVALGFAAGFVLLSQWQISRSVEQATVVERDTETVQALTDVAKPQRGVTTDAAGQLVSVQASFVPQDFTVLSGRVNFGTEGYWLVGHAVTDDGTSLAVALGWAATEKDALAADRPTGGTLEGRYEATEPPADDDFEAGERSAMSVATLINEWEDQPTAVYGGYLVLSGASSGLERIDSPPPSAEVVLNWLNIFYAVEWVVFAGFGVFLWWRFVRDAVEREAEEKAELN
jgi:cytochrome oxidase assembly protein ShyY1